MTVTLILAVLLGIACLFLWADWLDARARRRDREIVRRIRRYLDGLPPARPW